MGKPWENGMLGEVGNVGMANMERSHHFSWENSLFRLGHGFNSYFDIKPEWKCWECWECEIAGKTDDDASFLGLDCHLDGFRKA